MERPNAWKKYNEQDLAAVEALAVSYRSYLDHGKTERECTTETIAIAKENGYTDPPYIPAA